MLANPSVWLLHYVRMMKLNTIINIYNNIKNILHDESAINHFNPSLEGNQVMVHVPKKLLKVNSQEAGQMILGNLDADLVDIQDGADDLTIKVNFKVLDKTWDQMKSGQFLQEDNKIDQVIAIDMSSPNIAKPMSMVHFRSTVLGNLISNTYTYKGGKTIKINHLGDWGIPLSSIILAVKKWGDREKIEANPMVELDKLYRLYLENLQINPYLEEETLQIYKKLAYKEGEVYDLWQWLKDLSMDHFNEIYEKFDIHFDSIKGESFYAEENDQILDIIENNPNTSKKYDSIYLTVDDSEILIKDVDGHSTYLARDLAAAYHRYKAYHFDKSLYIIGKEQAEHFNKLKLVLKELGFDWSEKIQHVGYSPILLENSQNETPLKQDTIINNLTKRLTHLAEAYYDVSFETAEKIAVNSLVFETLNKYRDEILTINVDQLGEVLKNDAFKASKLHRELKLVVSDLDQKDQDHHSYHKEAVELTWLLSQFNQTVDQFLINYDSILVTQFMSELLETTHSYIHSILLHDRIDSEKVDYHLIQTTLKVLDKLCQLLGFRVIDHI